MQSVDGANHLLHLMSVPATADQTQAFAHAPKRTARARVVAIVLSITHDRQRVEQPPLAQ